MPPIKTPTSSLLGVELLLKRVWYRNLANIRRIFSTGASPGTSATPMSPATRLPQEIVEMIISRLVCHTPSLRACSLTCYSWYIVAAPHLHRILITPTYSWNPRGRFFWARPIQRMHNRGLLPLVRKFQVIESRSGPGFSPTRLGFRTLRQFSALTNVQELGIHRLDIPKFMPNLRRCFGHFLPTVRSLALREPKGSRRQIIYFIGLFQHLEDLKLLYNWARYEVEPSDDPTLTPPFAPPLRGSLMMTYFTRVGLLMDMIDLFGGIRFRHMDLYRVDRISLPLGACAETLETLRLYPTDQISFCHEHVNLSRIRSLRVLEIGASSMVGGEPGFLAHMVSTITSSAFSEVVVFHRDYDFCCIRRVGDTGYSPLYPATWDARVEEASRHQRRFELLREMHKVRGFRLVLWVDVWDFAGEYAMSVLRQAVAVEKASVGFDSLFPEPLLVYSPRRHAPEFLEDFIPNSACGWLQW